MDSKSVKVYSLLDPSAKIALHSGDWCEEAALISYVYTLTGPRRPQPSVEPEKTVYKNLRPWKKTPVPAYVVVSEGESLVGASIVAWDGKKSLQGDAPWGRPVVGKITAQTENGYEVALDADALKSAKTQANLRAQKLAEKTKPETPAEPLAAQQPVAVAGTAAKQPVDYTGDSFTVSADGHYIGDDGFVVPRNFDEFYNRYPKYVINWVKKRLNRFQVDDDVEDWTQDLLIHMKYLPVMSKHRTPGANGRENGCTDVIETFNPYQQYGASERRFRNYINFCLANKFNTVQSKRKKNPVCRPGNLPYGSLDETPEADRGGGDEYIHANSSHIAAQAERVQKQH